MWNSGIGGWSNQKKKKFNNNASESQFSKKFSKLRRMTKGGNMIPTETCFKCLQ